MVTTETAVMLAFLITNLARILAYLPQIIAIARDDGRAKTVSAATWTLFCVSNLCSALYAGCVTGDRAMLVAFAANTVCCAVIVGLLCWKRRMSRPVLGSHRG
ncbi:hypothetical protein SAMN04515666_103525 [Bosea lupini]|uniref:PQ loop repeat-containing protein n=1 Tax=Bosea lupini TaxID=1036779 RepID=A0A1H7PLS2_9HYPH|nr:hypothetical protein [Bosea lupini]SEL36428.1 hypothetical protein SAMN04515666_103525 [Bosea lupini]